MLAIPPILTILFPWCQFWCCYYWIELNRENPFAPDSLFTSWTFFFAFYFMNEFRGYSSSSSDLLKWKDVTSSSIWKLSIVFLRIVSLLFVICVWMFAWNNESFLIFKRGYLFWRWSILMKLLIWGQCRMHAGWCMLRRFCRNCSKSSIF